MTPRRSGIRTRDRRPGRAVAPPRRGRLTSTPQFAGLLAGLRLAMGVGARADDAETLHNIADWNAVASLARRHRVGSLLLRGVNAAANASPDAIAALGPLRRRTSIRGLGQIAALRHATDRLAESGIPSLVLKGLPLSERLFGTPLARECVDIDLLVPPNAVRDAERALSQGGWRLVKPSFHPTPARTRHYDRFVKDRLLAGPGGALELHHRLVGNPFLLQTRFESLRSNAAIVEIGGHRFVALGDDDLLLYLAVHGQLHRWSRLKWLCDMAALLGSINGNRFGAAVEKCRRQQLDLEPVFGVALRLCRESFDVELPSASASVPRGAWTGRAVRSTRRLWNRPKGGRGLQGIARRLDEMRVGLAMKHSWLVVAHELARLCVAPYDLGRVNLPDRLFFLYIPLRPVLWLASRIQRGAKRARRGPDPEA